MKSWAGKLFLFKIIMVFIICFCTGLGAFAQADFKIKNIVQDKAGNIILISGNNAAKFGESKVTFMSAPDRAVVDLPDAVLTLPKESLNIASKGITNFKISQFSTKPDVVRLVFTADSSNDFKNLTIKQENNTLLFVLNKIELQKQSIPVSQNKNLKDNTTSSLVHPTVINKNINKQVALLEKLAYLKSNEVKPTLIKQDQPFVVKSIIPGNNSVKIEGAGTARLKSPFILQNPTRIVYDMRNSSLNSKDLIRSIHLNFSDILKVGRFDPETVRLVIQSDEPQSYKVEVSPDLKSVSIVHKSGVVAHKVYSVKTVSKTETVNAAKYRPDKQIVKPRSLSEIKVVVDAGHGGTDPGAQRSGISEKDITLSVAKKVEERLLNRGIKVVMTRSDDQTVSLQDRRNITNRELPNVFVSVHVNSCVSPDGRGVETHWYTPQSKRLAEIIQRKMMENVSNIDRGIQQSMFYVIHHTEVPAVLVEIGFISNDNERAELLTEKRQDDTARAITEGIIEFLNEK